MRLCLVLLALIFARPATAEVLRFEVRGWGIPIGEMVLADNGANATGAFRTTGLAGAVAKVRFDMQRSGTLYRAALHTGRRDRKDQVAIPTTDRRLDPLSALLRALRPPDGAAGCALQAVVFDGRRALRLELTQDGPTRCRGTLTRQSGYSAEELAEARAFPIEIQYHTRAGALVAHKARVGTVHGKVTLIRRN